MEPKIDFVLIWVDGGDINWQKERKSKQNTFMYYWHNCHN